MATHAESEKRVSLKYFKPQVIRINIHEGVRRLNIAKFEGLRPMGNVASSDADEFVRCALMGMWREVADLVPPRIQWIERALSEGEKLGESEAFHRKTLLTAKVFLQWLMQSPGASSTWAEALDAHEAAMFEPNVYAKRDIATRGLDDFMLLSLLSGQEARGVSMYGRLHGGQLGKSSLRRASQPRTWALHACQHKLQHGGDLKELHTAGRGMLRAHLDAYWLGRGQYTRGAMWLLAVHGLKEPSLTPLQIILLAYEDLPDAEVPEGVLEQAGSAPIR